MFYNLFCRLESLGVDESASRPRYKVILCNRIALISFVLAFPYLFVFTYFDLTIAATAVIPTLILCTGILILNYYRYYDFASFLTIFGITGVVFFYSLHLGFNSGAHLIFFPLVAWPLILFTDHKRFLKLSGFLFLIFCFLFNHVIRIFFSISDHTLLNFEAGRIIYFFASITTISFVAATIFFFYNSEKTARKDLEISNHDLEIANSQIADKTRQDTEIEVAKKLQKEYLTAIPSFFPKYPEIKFYTYYEAARKLSGDYYAAHLDHENFRYCLIDITGKSVEAALTMVHVHTIITPMLYQAKSSIQKTMTDINNHICELPTEKRGCDVFLMNLNLKTLKFTYCNAGLETAYIIRQETIIPLITHGIKAGFESNEGYKSSTISLKKEDLLFLATDGFIEMTHKDNRSRYGYERVEVLLQSKKWDAPSLRQAILDEMKSFHGSIPVDDDTAFLIVSL